MDLLHLLIAERIVLLYSPSGAGKTSLIQAALVPRLEEKRFEVLPTMRVGLALSPDIHLPPDANRYVLSLLLSLQRGGKTERPIDSKQVQELAGMTLADWLDRRMEGISDERNMVLIFDQFEEILTSEPTNLEAKREFFLQVGDALDDRRRWAIFAMREDYVAGLDPYLRQVPTRLSTTRRLELLDKDSAREAMQGPAKEKDVTFADEAATRLVDDLCQIRVAQRDGTIDQKPGLYVEPVQLQVVCRRLWDEKFPPAEEMLPEGALIEERDIEAVGGVDSALADYYAERVTAIAADTGVRERIIRDWCSDVLIIGQGIRGQVLAGPSQGLDDTAVQGLVAAHLVRGEERRGSTWYELAHDRLIKPVRDNNDAWRKANLRKFQFEADRWHKAQRPNGLLLRSEELAQAERWADQAELLDFEKDFLKESQKAREAAEREKRQARRVLVLSIIAIAIGIVTIFALFRASQLAQDLRREQAVASTAQADALQQEYAADAANMQARKEAENAATAQSDALQQEATADAASMFAAQARATAEAAITTAIDQQQTAAAANNNAIATSTAAAQQQQTAEANLNEVNVDREKLAVQLESAVAKAAADEAAREQLQSQLDQVRAEQTAVAERGATQTAVASQTAIAATRTAVVEQTAIAATQTAVAIIFPPSGRIVFVSTRLGNKGTLFLINADGSGDVIPLIRDSEAFDPSYSPGIDSIVWSTAALDIPEKAWLYTMNPDIGVVKNIGGQARDDWWQPAFSPDGQQVAFVSARDGNPEIYLMNADGSGLKRLTDHPDGDIMPAWSPDGKYIAFVSEREGQADIWLMDADGGNLVRLTFNDAQDVYPAWSPDGRQIAFGSDRDGNVEIYTMDGDGRNQRNLTNSPFDENYPAWSPDGNWLAFSRFTTNNEVFLMTIAGDHVTNLTNHPAMDLAPIWIPH